MEFKILFDNVKGYPIDIPTKNDEADTVDWLHWKLESTPFQVTISEKVAYDSNCFGDQNSLIVMVPNQFLNQYTYQGVIIERNNDTGETLYVRVDLEIDVVKIIEDWKAAGYPVNWGFRKEDE